ncbi:hypothetical protein HZS_803 [Henneguya salminicola]|nr:hypothetical protein HZS_803 [Henneguya salminicola]
MKLLQFLMNRDHSSMFQNLKAIVTLTIELSTCENSVDLQTGANKNILESNWRWAKTFLPLTATRNHLYASYQMEHEYEFVDGCKLVLSYISVAYSRKINPFVSYFIACT